MYTEIKEEFSRKDRKEEKEKKNCSTKRAKALRYALPV